ncbi:peptidoglycan DD-metalloendopeptidase family protein [Saprospiraceae bacterium]|nr:peptidoglycan DD-metalloendopeptidase family protein [Saprospiraceae bacterium]MDB4163460.1 peptidoglycan DD-metalloendopeptidase family protein [Saprospiraceae bacterium]MDB4824368.1 peptidoglycan DD-metalloendopeptidase family protein [Saprospiraceae bacterium]MDB9914585.1 peptidoglycan DD-metalloendopeptidase family protein [Saprospiraceae bacterium]
MKGCKLILLFLFCCIISITLSAQDREQLEQERMQVIESIEATDDLIASSEADRQKGIATLVALRGQIDQRNTLLNNIKQSISAAEFEIEFNLATLDSLTQRVKSIKDQYAILLRSKYVRRLIGSKWITIFSTSNINKAFLRWNYYRQFDTYRESKIKEIESIRKIVAQKNKEIKKHAIENSALIQEQQQQNSELQKRIEQQNELIKELQKDKTILQSQLLVIKEARESLNQAIESRVINELSGVKIGSDRGKSNESNPVIVKGKVMLPITNGYIENFSISDEDKTSTISLSVAKGARVISIAPGRVVSVKDVSGFGRMIILQHGDYYSVYAKMNNVIVSVGNRVEKNTVLGSVDSTENKLHFELWKDKVRLDANKWIEE